MSDAALDFVKALCMTADQSVCDYACEWLNTFRSQLDTRVPEMPGARITKHVSVPFSETLKLTYSYAHQICNEKEYESLVISLETKECSEGYGMIVSAREFFGAYILGGSV